MLPVSTRCPRSAPLGCLPADLPFLSGFSVRLLQHNEAGRGAELSELVLYNRKLLTFDDRTGIMFEVANFEDSGAGAAGSKAREADRPALIPRQLFMEGDGATDKGMKIEWATLKDGLLWIGSFGKEYTDSAGNILHANNLWVKVMSEKGVIQVRRRAQGFWRWAAWGRVRVGARLCSAVGACVVAQRGVAAVMDAAPAELCSYLSPSNICPTSAPHLTSS